jgi:hypothetical protein
VPVLERIPADARAVERDGAAAPGVRAPAPPAERERAARRTLRDQIAGLERELVAVAASVQPPLVAAPPAPGRGDGPHLLTLGELERARDELAGRVADLRAARADRLDRQDAARVALERMLLEPARHKWRRITNADLGEPGCKSYHVRPRLGLVGLLAGWWHVKVSSGCPLGVPDRWTLRTFSTGRAGPQASFIPGSRVPARPR